MSRLHAVVLLALAGCPPRPQVPVEDTVAAEPFQLSTDASTDTVGFTASASAAAMEIEPDVRSAIASAHCDVTSYLGICDECTPTVTATLLADGTEVASDSASLRPGSSGELMVEDWEAFASCPPDVPCEQSWQLDLELEGDGLVQVRCTVSASVWVEETADGLAPEDASVAVTVH